MKSKTANVFVSLAALGVWLAACSGAGVTSIEQSGEGATGPQKIENATTIIKFDPTSIALTGDPVEGTCHELGVIPGTYRCDLASEVVGPCFALGATRLLCGPDPVHNTYAALVTPTGELPVVTLPSPDRTIPFFVALDNGMTCHYRAAPEPVIIGGVLAQYECDEPYTFLLGEGNLPFSRDTPLWEAGLYTLDPATGTSPSGKVPVNVLQVWVP
ncbi:MAG: hypothetical protein DCC51_02075 [Anaerolineae bacterium]|nr:MAG: hypothetical protein DCC51_02075 [Anaerolineae bacterium]